MAARRVSAELDNPSYISLCQASSQNCRTMVCAKSPLGCSARARFMNCGASRKNANVSSSRPLPSTSPAYVSNSLACPTRSREQLGDPGVFFGRGQIPNPLAEPLTEHQAGVTEPQQIVEQRCGSVRAA